MKLIPYPLNAFQLRLAFHPFTIFGGSWFWFVNRNSTLSENAKREGRSIWWLRIGPFTLSYARLV